MLHRGVGAGISLRSCDVSDILEGAVVGGGVGVGDEQPLDCPRVFGLDTLAHLGNNSFGSRLLNGKVFPFVSLIDLTLNPFSLLTGVRNVLPTNRKIRVGHN